MEYQVCLTLSQPICTKQTVTSSTTFHISLKVDCAATWVIPVNVAKLRYANFELLYDCRLGQGSRAAALLQNRTA